MKWACLLLLAGASAEECVLDACLENGGHDDDCCGIEGRTACADGYSYSLVIFEDTDLPNNFAQCNIYAGNTCCVQGDGTDTPVGYPVCSECQDGCGGSDSEECWNTEHTAGEFGVCDCDGQCEHLDNYQGDGTQLCTRSESDSGECQAWGYGSEECSDMDCNECHNSEECDWGNYFDVLDTNPSGYGYSGPWASDAWEETPTDLDAIRMSPGCSVEVMIYDGSTYTYHSDTRLCGNEVGCDAVRRVRVFKTGTTSGDGLPGSDECEDCPAGYTRCNGFCDLDGDCAGDDWCEAYDDYHVNCALDCGENFDSTEPYPICTSDDSKCRTDGDDCYGACDEPQVCADEYQPVVDPTSCELKCFPPGCNFATNTVVPVQTAVPVQQCRDCSEYKTRNLLFARLPCC